MTYQSDKNCFSCTGNAYKPCYNPKKDSKVCMWYEVAQNDLNKLEEGKKNITLSDMLEKYLGTETFINKLGK